MKITVYRCYRFIDKAPTIDAMRTVFHDEGMNNYAAHQVTGVATATFDNWFAGPTRNPKDGTLTQTAAALGYVRRDTLLKNGQVDVAYIKVRDLDFRKEIEKQADWMLKQHTRKRKRRRAKANGHKRARV